MTYRPCAPGDKAWDGRLLVSGGTWTWGGDWNPAFTPDHTPSEMTRMGVFGDAYWGDAAGRERRTMLPPNTPCARGERLFTNIRGVQCRDLNYFGRPASLTRDWWLDRGLIMHPDPLGWFEWFNWYHAGRRWPGYDDWQISRWVSFRKRHLRMYFLSPSNGQAQALLHWGISARRGSNGSETGWG